MIQVELIPGEFFVANARSQALKKQGHTIQDIQYIAYNSYLIKYKAATPPFFKRIGEGLKNFFKRK